MAIVVAEGREPSVVDLARASLAQVKALAKLGAPEAVRELARRLRERR